MSILANRETNTRMPTLELPDVARDSIGAALSGLRNPEADPDDAMTVVHKVFATLPDDILRSVLDFGRHVDTPGVALLTNLPVDDQLPPTPADGGPCRDKPTFVGEGVLLGLSGLLGEPVSFVTEKDGRIVHDVIPTESGATTQTSQGSAVFLNFHNDIVHDAVGRYDISNPDFLVLNCLRGAEQGDALTCYADARDIVAVLGDEVVEVLRQPLFRLNAPGGYTRMFAAGQEVYSEPVPLISGPDHAPEVSVAANGVKRLSDEADRAFAALQDACRAPEVAQIVNLVPGQALLINNRKGVHSRSQFAARYDGTDRWLQRTYIRRSFWNIRDRAVPESRRTHR